MLAYTLVPGTRTQQNKPDQKNKKNKNSGAEDYLRRKTNKNMRYKNTRQLVTETNGILQTKKQEGDISSRTYEDTYDNHIYDTSITLYAKRFAAETETEETTWLVPTRKRQDETNDVQNRNRKKGKKTRKIKQINHKNARKKTAREDNITLTSG